MKYCYECGTPLIIKPLKDEGDIPYCESCGCFRFPIFSTAVSIITLDPQKEKILLIKQYGRDRNILVAGYVNKGENAENAVVRELKEETGLDALELRFNKSEYFERTNTLMLNYVCTAGSESLEGLNRQEVDEAQWFGFEEAKRRIAPGSLAEKFLLRFLSHQKEMSFNSMKCGELRVELFQSGI